MFRVPYIPNIEGIYEFLRSIYTRLGGSVLTKCFVVEIGDWDMSTDATKTVEYKQTLDDINYKSVLNVSVQIYNDDKTKSYFSGTDDFDSIYVDSTTKNVTITRGSFFDSTDFNLTSSGDATFKSRGRIILWVAA